MGWCPPERSAGARHPMPTPCGCSRCHQKSRSQPTGHGSPVGRIGPQQQPTDAQQDAGEQQEQREGGADAQLRQTHPFGFDLQRNQLQPCDGDVRQGAQQPAYQANQRRAARKPTKSPVAAATPMAA